MQGSDSAPTRWMIPAALVGIGAAGWGWSLQMARDMAAAATSMPGMAMTEMVSAGGFLFAWVAMMAAMMFPAIVPVVRLYALAAARGGVAPLPLFVSGYLAVWALPGIPAYFLWRWLDGPLTQAEPWAARLAGAVLLGAAAWQLSPWKAACLRHCRSPMSFFLRHGGRIDRALDAFRLGFLHGLFCFGCCWAMMAVLVALGTMNVAWMAVLSLLILVEKNGPAGYMLASASAGLLAGAGALLLWDPGWMDSISLHFR